MSKRTTCWDCNGNGYIKGVSDWAHLHDPEDSYLFTENRKCKKCDGKGYIEPPTTQRPRTGEKKKESGCSFVVGIVVLIILFAIFNGSDDNGNDDSESASQFLSRQDAERQKKIDECRVKIGEAKEMMNDELKKCEELFELVEASITKQNEIEADYQRLQNQLKDLEK